MQATEYTDLGYVTEFRYGPAMTRAVQDFGSFKNVGVGGGMLDSGHALVFVDNHDNQRGHGAGGNMVTFHRPDDYKLVQVSNSWNQLQYDQASISAGFVVAHFYSSINRCIKIAIFKN